MKQTKEQKKTEILAFMHEEIYPEIKKQLERKLEQALRSGAIPDEWMEKGTYILAKAIVDSFCRDRPYRLLSNTERANANNLNKLI